MRSRQKFQSRFHSFPCAEWSPCVDCGKRWRRRSRRVSLFFLLKWRAGFCAHELSACTEKGVQWTVLQGALVRHKCPGEKSRVAAARRSPDIHKYVISVLAEDGWPEKGEGSRCRDPELTSRRMKRGSRRYPWIIRPRGDTCAIHLSSGFLSRSWRPIDDRHGLLDCDSSSSRFSQSRDTTERLRVDISTSGRA